MLLLGWAAGLREDSLGAPRRRPACGAKAEGTLVILEGQKNSTDGWDDLKCAGRNWSGACIDLENGGIMVTGCFLKGFCVYGCRHPGGKASRHDTCIGTGIGIGPTELVGI